MFLSYRVNSKQCFCLHVLHSLLVIACLADTSYASCDETDLESLLSFSDPIYSQPPLNWSNSTDCCTWEGVGCGDNRRVYRLWLPSRGLVGSISPSITNLSYLSELNLSSNSLFGALPDRLFTLLNRLEIIDLSYNRLQGQLSWSDKLPTSILSVNISSNRLSGTIQSSFLQTAFNVGIFNVSNNSFSGTIPASICSISPSITHLDFSFNDFVGHIPKGFGECFKLETLRAMVNNLSGPIPDDIYRVSTLHDVSLAGNRLSGSIDKGIGNLSNLKILALQENQLSGIIPDSIGRLQKLEQLFLHGNNLNGTIPFSLSNCSKLTTLILSNNNLEGELAAFDFSTLVLLRTIDLGANFLTGSLPRSLYLCKSLTSIRLSSNRMQGEILLDIQALESLSFLALSNNSLTNFRGAIKALTGCKNLRTLIVSLNFFNESLPSEENLIEFDGFQNLQLLGLGGCGFIGETPMWLIKLQKLEVLDLSQNQISGSIPGWIANISNLFYLDLRNNLFSGNFPPELLNLPRLSSDQSFNQLNRRNLDLHFFVQPGNAGMLQYKQSSSMPAALYLGSNSLRGNIPPEISLLRFIHVLDLSDNQFSGEIPESISEITSLEKLDLSGNHLSGKIPASLKNLHFLSSFSVANNNLDGPIPTGGQFNTFSSASFEGNPGLCGQILNSSCSEKSESPEQIAATGWGIAKDSMIIYLNFVIGFGFSFLITVKISCNLTTRFASSIASCFLEYGHKGKVAPILSPNRNV